MMVADNTDGMKTAFTVTLESILRYSLIPFCTIGWRASFDEKAPVKNFQREQR